MWGKPGHGCDAMKLAFPTTDQTPSVTRIRLATAVDLPRIQEIHLQSCLPEIERGVPHPSGPKDWDTWWKSHTPTQHPVWVHEEDGEVLAWSSLSPLYRRKAFRSTVQCSIYVAPEAQRRGIGTRLVTHLMEECPTLGIRTVLAFISPRNEASLKIFHRAGLLPWGNFPAIDAAPHTDAMDVVMLGRTID